MKGQAIRYIFFYNTHATPKKDAAAVLCAKQLNHMALARVSRVSIPCGLRPLKKLHGSEIFSTRSRLASEC